MIYEGYFSHPAFGPVLLDIHVCLDTPVEGRWQTIGQTHKIAVQRRANGRVLLYETDDETQFDGVVDSQTGTISGEVVQSGVRGGSFDLTLVSGPGLVPPQPLQLAQPSMSIGLMSPSNRDAASLLAPPFPVTPAAAVGSPAAHAAAASGLPVLLRSSFGAGSAGTATPARKGKAAFQEASPMPMGGGALMKAVYGGASSPIEPPLAQIVSSPVAMSPRRILSPRPTPAAAQPMQTPTPHGAATPTHPAAGRIPRHSWPQPPPLTPAATAQSLTLRPGHMMLRQVAPAC